MIDSYQRERRGVHDARMTVESRQQHRTIACDAIKLADPRRALLSDALVLVVAGEKHVIAQRAQSLEYRCDIGAVVDIVISREQARVGQVDVTIVKPWDDRSAATVDHID